MSPESSRNKDQRSATDDTPVTKTERQGIGLCLSGGGFRAALFHLGALRRLNELGILGQVTQVSSVSGGSILAGYLAEYVIERGRLPNLLQPEVWNREFGDGFKAVTRNDFRTGPLLDWLNPCNWFCGYSAVVGLEAKYRRFVIDRKLTELPECPEFVFCATDLVYGVNWEFSRSGIGDYASGYVSEIEGFPTARAIAASSCFPPIFRPMLMERAQATGPERPPVAAKSIRLTDGGVYDNLAVEPVWKNCKAVLVSDGGAPFRFKPANWIFSQLYRYHQVMAVQSEKLRKRMLIAGITRQEYAGCYWSVGSGADHYRMQVKGSYTKSLAQELISRIRTDLNHFTDAEIEILENHGYCMTEAAVSKHASQLIKPGALDFKLPNEAWSDPERVRQALRYSHRRIRWPST